MMERNKKRGQLNPKLTSQIKGVDRISKMSLYQSWEVKGVKSEGTEKEEREREKKRREEEEDGLAGPDWTRTSWPHLFFPYSNQ